jgi:asparagine synthase (glutamine-hydrolysing)
LGYVPTWIAAKATLALRVRSLLAPELRVDDPFGVLLDRLGTHHGARLHTSTDTWNRTALAQYILRTLGDGMEMAHGIAGRVPFLDHHVAEAALAIDPATLVGTGLDKPVLRAAVADLVPAHVLGRAKHPFLAPPLARLAPALVQDTLRAHARASPLVDRASLLAILDRLPAMTEVEQQAWDPALMLVLSGAILQARYAA